MSNRIIYGMVWTVLMFLPIFSFAATPDSSVRTKSVEAWSFGDFDEAERWAEKDANDRKRLETIKNQKRRYYFLLDEASKAMKQGNLLNAWKLLEKAEKINDANIDYLLLKRKLMKRLDERSSNLFPASDWNRSLTIVDEKAFKRFAKIEKNRLNIVIPQGNGWAKTGIKSFGTPFGFVSDQKRYGYELQVEFGEKTEDFIVQCGDIVRVTYHKDEKTLRMFDGRYSAYYSRWNEWDKKVLASAPLSIRILIEPSGFVSVELPNGESLQHRFLPGEKALNEDYGFEIISQPSKKGASSKTFIKSIKMTDYPYLPHSWSRFDNYEKVEPVLNGALEDLWTGFGRFHPFVRFKNSVMNIEIPKNAGNVKAGIQSTELLWLDRFGNNSYIELVLEFDKTKTNSFNIGMSHLPGVGDLWNDYLVFSWKKGKQKSKSVVSLDRYSGDDFRMECNVSVVERVTVRFEPGRVTFELPDGFQKSFEWDGALAHSGIHFFLYAVGEGNKMAVKKAWVRRKAGKEEVFLPSVLPEKELFGPSKSDAWEQLELEGGNFKKDVRFENGALVSKLDKKQSLSAMVGLCLKKEKRVILDERLEWIPIKFVFKTQPEKTNSFLAGLSRSGNRSRWARPYEVKGLRFIESNGKGWLTLFDGYDNEWTREIPSWMLENWNGKIDITLMPNRTMRTCLAPDICIAAPVGFSKYDKLYLLVTPRRHEKISEDALMVLERISYQWQLQKWPEGVERWKYVSEEDFNATEFVNDLMEALP